MSMNDRVLTLFVFGPINHTAEGKDRKSKKRDEDTKMNLGRRGFEFSLVSKRERKLSCQRYLTLRERKKVSLAFLLDFRG